MGSLLYDPSTLEEVFDESDLLDLLDPEDVNEAVAPAAAAAAAAAAAGDAPVTGQDASDSWNPSGDDECATYQACLSHLLPQLPGPLHPEQWVPHQYGVAFAVQKEFLGNCIRVPFTEQRDGTFVQHGQLDWAPGGNKALAEAVRVHGSKLVSSSGGGPFRGAASLFRYSHNGTDRLKSGSIRFEKPGMTADGERPAFLEQLPESSPGFRMFLYCAAPYNCPSAAHVIISLADYLYPCDYGGVPYVWVRWFWASRRPLSEDQKQKQEQQRLLKQQKQGGASGGASSSRSHSISRPDLYSPHADVGSVGRVGCRCQWATEGGQHDSGVTSGSYRAVHAFKDLTGSYNTMPSQLAGMSLLRQQQHHPDKVAAGDTTGVLMDATAQRERAKQQRQLWCHQQPQSAAMFAVHKRLVEADEKLEGGKTVTVREAKINSLTRGRLSLSFSGRDFSALVISKDVVVQLVDLMARHSFGLHIDFTGGLTMPYGGKATKVFVISAPHHRTLAARQDGGVQRTKGSSPIPLAVAVTTSGTGYKVMDWLRILRELFAVIKPGFKVPYVIADMALEEATAFAEGFNLCTLPEYMGQLEAALIEAEMRS